MTTKRNLALGLSLAVALSLLVAPLKALAAVWTDLPDYAPGSVVTISGDNSDGAGYLAGETVYVDVNGPNGYTATCEAVADDNGAWSCQVTLWDSELAVGEYTYTATGLSSGVSQSGTFTDAAAANVNFATSGLPAGVSITITGNVTNNGNQPASINETFSSPGPSANTGTLAGTSFTYSGYPSSVVAGTQTCTLTGTSPASGSNSGAAGSVTTVTGAYSCVSANNAPTVAANNASVKVNEGQTAINSGTWSDTNAGDTVTLSASVGTVIKSGTNAAGTWSWSFSTTDGPNQSQTVTITANDGNGGSNIATFSLTVDNVAPTIAISGASNVDEGSPYSLTLGAVTDPGADTVTSYIVHWGDGFSDTYSSNGVKTHIYADGLNVYAITVDLVDEDGTFLDQANAKSVTVDNVKPTIAISGASNVDEGSSYSLTLGAVTDPGTDTVTSYIVHWGDGNSDTYPSNGVKTHTYADGPNSYNITVDLVDEDGTFLDRANAQSVMVDNVAPTVTASFASANVSCGSNNATLNVSFTDPGVDTHTAVVNWGDGSGDQSLGTVTSPFAASHTYGAAGMYNATVTVTDSDGAPGSDSSNAVTVNFTIVGGGILQPINPGPPNSVFKYGSTIPVKVKVQDCDGSYPGNLTLKVTWQLLSSGSPTGDVSEPYSTSAADTGNTMRFTGAPDYQYIFNLASKSFPDGTATYRIYVTIQSTNQVVSADIGLKSK